MNTITIAGHSFYLLPSVAHTSTLPDSGGVYVIVDLIGYQFTVIDCGESGQLRTRLSNHDRAPSWRRHARGLLAVAVRLTSGWTAQQRRTLEGRIRSTYQPPCGEQ